MSWACRVRSAPLRFEEFLQGVNFPCVTLMFQLVLSNHHLLLSVVVVVVYPLYGLFGDILLVIGVRQQERRFK